MMIQRPIVLVAAISAAVLGASLGAAASASAPGTAPATAPATTSQPATAKARELAVTQADAGKTLTLGDNTVVVISLAGNATTGYSWAVTKITGTALEQAGEIQYVPVKAQPGAVGSGGTSVAKFKAVKAGQTTITLGYARPWENGTPPAKTFEVTIVVDKVP